jgi:hypothetical protein
LAIVGVAVAGLDPCKDMILTGSEPFDGGEAFRTDPNDCVGKQNAFVVVVGVDTDIGDKDGENVVPGAPGFVVVVEVAGRERDLPFDSFDPFPSFEPEGPKRLERRCGCAFLVEEELVAAELVDIASVWSLSEMLACNPLPFVHSGPELRLR